MTLAIRLKGYRMSLTRVLISSFDNMEGIYGLRLGRGVPIATFKITKGAVREYQSTGENGSEIYRGFCENCGSPVATRLTRLPQVIGIPAGSMDDPSRHQPTMDLFVRDAQAWDCMNPDLKKFETSPPPRSN
jgi:hypothetical protein